MKRALKDLISYPLEAVQKAIRIAQSMPNAKNPPALYTVALREGWELPVSAQNADTRQRKMSDFQARLDSDGKEHAMHSRDEQPISEPLTSPIGALPDADRQAIQLEARRRVARLLGRTLERVTETNPLVEGVMLEVAEERKRLSAA